MPRLLSDIVLAHADGSYPRVLARLAKAHLLILDDWGLAPLAAPDARELLEVIEYHVQVRATLMLPRPPGRLGRTKCTAEVVTFLRDAKTHDPTLSGATLAARVEERFGIRLHRRTVERVLGLRRRRPKIKGFRSTAWLNSEGTSV